jgi:hypothetical protein
MKYTPKTEEQLAQEALLPDGTYDFEIIDTDDKPSKKGNDMITLKLWVFSDGGEQRHIFDYIAMGNHFGERKLRHAANACGLLEIYNSGKIVHTDFMGTTGKVLLKQQKGTDDFPLPKNIVADYLPRGEETVVITKPIREVIDDDIPF